MRSYEITDVPKSISRTQGLEYFISFFDEDGAIAGQIELPITYSSAEKMGDLWVSDGKKSTTAVNSGDCSESPAPELRPTRSFLKGPGGF